MQPTRRLAAILFTDIVGSTAIMQKDEVSAVSINKRYVSVLKEFVTSYHGEILNDYGDGSLCTFHSATEALKCAIEIQQQLQREPKVPLRIGLHVGEIFFDDGKVFGDGVNVASRVQSLGVANSILFSSEINSKIKNQQGFKSVSVGKFHFKNVDEPMEVFALANEGFVVPDKNKMEGKLRDKKSNRNKIFIAAILIAVVSFFLYRYLFNKEILKGKEKSIAILPFTIIGANSDNISEGLVEDILIHLSKISKLDKVISNRSSSRYAGTKKSPGEIGDELNVNSLVMGSIQQLGDTIRVSAQLVDCKSGSTLWADNYTKEKKQIFDLETELATRIVNAMKTKLTLEEEKGLSKRYTENVEAYKFYLKGRTLWNKLGRENIDSAESNYKRALELDPDYALAYAGIADCHSFNFKGLPQLDEVPIAKIYVAKALSLDSTLSEALTTLGFIQQNFDYDWAGAKTNLEKAIDLDPNNFAAHMYYGLLLMHSTPDKEGSLRELKKAVDLNPLAYVTNWQLSRNYYFAGKYDLAIDQFKKAAFLAPNKLQQNIPVFSMGLVYLKKNQYAQAKDIFDHLPEGNKDQPDNYQVMQSYAYAIMGDKPKAKALLEETLKKYPDLSSYRNAQVYVALGDFSRAMDQLEVGYKNRDVHMFWVGVDPAFDPVRNEQSFKGLLKKMNLN
jgi:adenylate cyclase